MKKILLVVFLLILSVCVYAATKPDNFRYETSIEIDAPAKKIFPHIANLRANRQWSPWEQIDPDMKRTYTGPESGVGAKYEWDGDNGAGAGKMEIIESEEPNKLVSRLEFIKPMAAVNTAEFTLNEQGGKTTVTWAMYGPNNFIGKLISVFIDCEAMITTEFDKGLGALKRLVETGKAEAPAPAAENAEPAANN